MTADTPEALTNSEQISVTGVWPAEMTTTVAPLVNQIAIQMGIGVASLPEEVLVTLGQASPPLVSGSVEEQAAQLRGVTHLPINPIARFALTRDRAEQLASMLVQAVQIWDGAHGRNGGGEDS